MQNVDFKDILDYMLYGCSQWHHIFPLSESVDCCVVWSWSDNQEIESEHESDSDAKLKDVMVAVGE